MSANCKSVMLVILSMPMLIRMASTSETDGHSCAGRVRCHDAEKARAMSDLFRDDEDGDDAESPEEVLPDKLWSIWVRKMLPEM